MDAQPTEPQADGQRKEASLCEEAREHLKQRRVEEGEAAAREAVQLDPQSDDAHTLLGIALCQKSKYIEGIEALGRAVTINPANVTARSNLATARQQAGHLEDARAEWLAILALDPSNTKARGALAVVEWQIQHATGRPPASPLSAPSSSATLAQQPAAPANVRYDLAGNPVPIETTSAPGYGQPAPASAYQPPPRPRDGAGRPSERTATPNALGEDPGGWSPSNVMAILFSPSEFFHGQRGHYGIVKPLVFSIINGLLVGGALLTALLVGSARASANAGAAMAGTTAEVVVQSIVGFVLGIGLQFGLAGLLHLIVRLLGGRQPYGATYRALIYSATPAVCCYVVAIVAMLFVPTLVLLVGSLMLTGVIWSLVATVIGLGILHDISSWRHSVPSRSWASRCSPSA